MYLFVTYNHGAQHDPHRGPSQTRTTHDLSERELIEATLNFAKHRLKTGIITEQVTATAMAIKAELEAGQTVVAGPYTAKKVVE